MAAHHGIEGPDADYRVSRGRWLIVFVLVLVISTLAVAFPGNGSQRWWLVSAAIVGSGVGIAAGRFRLAQRVASISRPVRGGADRAVGRVLPALRQVPPPPAAFSGRVRELSSAEAYLRVSGHSPRIILVHGADGIGKTAFVLALVERVADAFPDGQLLVRPGGTEDLPGLDRHARALVLIEDVQSPAQLEGIVPSGGNWGVVVTSREPLTLSVGSSLDLRLGPLDESSALQVLRAVLGDERVDSEPSEARRIVELLEGMPVAVRAAAAGLALAPHLSLADALARVNDFRQRTTTPDHPIDLAYLLLTNEEQRTFRMFGLFAEPVQPSTLADVLQDDEQVGVDDRRALVRATDAAYALARVGLVERASVDAVGAALFDVHPLIRAYAWSRLKGETAHGDRNRLKERVLQSRRARLAVVQGPSRLRDTVYKPLARGQLSVAGDAARQAATIARERRDRDGEALAMAALAHLRLELGSFGAAEDLARSALAMDVSSGAVGASARRCLGELHRRLRQTTDAERELRLALELCPDDPEERIQTLRDLSLVQAQDSATTKTAELTLMQAVKSAEGSAAAAWLLPTLRWTESVVLQTLGRFAESGRAISVGLEIVGEQHLWYAWLRLREAELRLLQAELASAQAAGTAAMEAFAVMNHDYGKARCRLVIGEIQVAQRRPKQARAMFEEALASFASCGDRWSEAEASRLLATDPGTEHRQRESLAVTAGRIFKDLRDDQRHEVVEAQLQSLRKAQPRGKDSPSTETGAI